MASAHDVAVYLRNAGIRSRLQLQKLLYYAQAWSLAWDDRPLFSETIKAWDLGPVVGEVWYALQHHELDGDPSRLTAEDRATIDAVVDFYGAQPADWLSELTHRERPWSDARQDKRPNPVISHEAMRAFYGAMRSEGEKIIPHSYRRGAALVMSLSPEELDELADDTMTEITPDALAALVRDDGAGAWPSS